MANIKNIAIIAHVDHGKTTMVDKIMYHCQLFRENENTGDLNLNKKELERERGNNNNLKNLLINYKGKKINVIEPSGQGDFCGGVERVINLGEWVLLKVGGFGGSNAQTPIVIQKAIDLG